MTRLELTRKAASALLHPICLGAILLLLLNDHLLRRFWPSWLTGKLGDFAWLFFFPFVTLLLLAWISPTRVCRRKDVLALAAFGLVGGVFSLAKTIPACHRLLVEISETILGMPVGWRLDPTDLIALPALLVAWGLWRRAPTLPVKRLQPIGMVILICAWLTIANAARPEVGIAWVGYQDGKLYAATNYNRYFSQDGGETWKNLGQVPRGLSVPDWGYEGLAPMQTWEILEDPARPGALLRYKSNEDIESSSDGGQTWQVEHKLKPISEAQRAYYFKMKSANAVVVDWPLMGVADPVTKNVVFAMGHAGILLRRADGTYQNVTVGPYAPPQMAGFEVVWKLINSELWLSLILGCLAAVTLSLRWGYPKFKLWGLIILWMYWAGLAIFFPPALEEGPYAMVIPSIGLVVISTLVLPFTLDTFVVFGSLSTRHLLRLLIVLIGCALLYFIPIVLWGFQLVPFYYLAMLLGLGFSGFLLWWQSSQLAPLSEVEKRIAAPGLAGAEKLLIIGVLILLIGGVLTGAGAGVIILAAGYLVILAGLVMRWRAVFRARREKPTQSSAPEGQAPLGLAEPEPEPGKKEE
jgi:hypothetical protein